MKHLLDKFFKDKEGNVVIGETPNWQIIAAFLFYIAHRAFIEQSMNELLYILFLIFYAWWALLELFSGANYFRKTIGLLSIILIIFLIFYNF